MCLAALTATLAHYLKGEALRTIPVWQMIATQPDALDERASRWSAILRDAGLDCEVMDGESVVGGGSLPGQTLPTRLLAIDVGSADQAAHFLREQRTPVIVRREGDRLLVDPRTVRPQDEDDLLAALHLLAALDGGD